MWFCGCVFDGGVKNGWRIGVRFERGDLVGGQTGNIVRVEICGWDMSEEFIVGFGGKVMDRRLFDGDKSWVCGVVTKWIEGSPEACYVGGWGKRDRMFMKERFVGVNERDDICGDDGEKWNLNEINVEDGEDVWLLAGLKMGKYMSLLVDDARRKILCDFIYFVILSMWRKTVRAYVFSSSPRFHFPFFSLLHWILRESKMKTWLHLDGMK